MTSDGTEVVVCRAGSWLAEEVAAAALPDVPDEVAAVDVAAAPDDAAAFCSLMLFWTDSGSLETGSVPVVSLAFSLRYTAPP